MRLVDLAGDDALKDYCRSYADERGHIDGRRFIPTFQVAGDMSETFDAMVEELVDYRLARFLFTKRSPLEEAFRYGSPVP